MIEPPRVGRYNEILPFHRLLPRLDPFRWRNRLEFMGFSAGFNGSELSARALGAGAAGDRGSAGRPRSGESRAARGDQVVTAVGQGEAALPLVDAVGMVCPQPIILLAKAIRGLTPGEELLFRADDPGAERDLRDWTQALRHSIVAFERGPGARIEARIQRRSESAGERG
jgi:tRNA 2-thiouridine synthesizing protein A